ncbi:hypothetical protein JCM11641_006415 [Rhodosporidiobolus odoratus]
MASLPPPPSNQRFSTLATPPPPHSSSSSPSPFSTLSRPDPAINDALARDFPEVAQLSRDDMQLLLEDPAYFDAYFNTMPQALALHQEVEAKMRENIEMAERSESMKPDLERLREDTARLFNEANEFKMRWGYLDEAQRDTYKRFSQHAQLSRVRAATTQQERLSDAVLSAFLSGQGDDESFIKQYREVRKVYHKREVGLRKWEEGKVVWM